MAMFADVYIGYPLDECFTYRIPDEIRVAPCMRVKVNFAGRNMTAYVHRVHDEEPRDFEVKDIIGVIDTEPIFDERLLDLAEYTAAAYLSSVGEALSMALPSGLKPSKRFKNPFPNAEHREVRLNPGQQKIFDDIMASRGGGDRSHLIFGVTGSGKTEIYIELARRIIEEERSVIYLVPEISLSSMIFERLYGVFGDCLIIYHSHLSPNQRLHNWIRFYRGEARVVVGTRSAVFLQCPRLGMIIIDEEHDGSYKEQSAPRYNARRVALHRSRTETALVVMGSATPAVETLYACERGPIRLHTMASRYGGASLPDIEIVRIGSTKPKHIISTALKLATKRAVDSGRQVIYLLNRRGFAPIVICNRCGWTVECPHCNISMNFHRDRSMLCHYCGHRSWVPARCGKCGSDHLDKVGSGTQRVEEVIAAEFRNFNMFRLDQDSSRKKNTVPDLIGKMKRGEVDILVGTQLVAKGFDFHNITLVGVLLADIGMNLPDFRATERVFSLLVQVAGRSGRGDAPGKVIVQTLNEENPLFRYIKRQDYYGFYRSELLVREALHYPPFARIARLLVRGKNEDRVIASVSRLKAALDENIGKRNAGIRVLGPSSAPFGKIGGNYRHHIILKAEDVAALRGVIADSRDAVSGRDVYLEIDIDPYDLL
ncbi:MAG: primosomal protein N' [Spirochaetes bacterium RBG_13_51_14]|nr:MAG: primosomal protein N' [Spirochaetes bacterium RBG_13_51_14]